MTNPRNDFASMSTEDLLDGYSDCYKSLHNVRPSANVSRDALIEFWTNYDANFEAMMAGEKAQEQRAIERFEATVASTMAIMPLANRADVLRILTGDQDDEEHFEYLNGLPFGYLKKAA